MPSIKGHLKKLIQSIAGESPESYTYVPRLENHAIPQDLLGDLMPDECYVELFLESLRLEKARRFGTKFNGVVYSLVRMARAHEPESVLSAVSKPARLSELDEAGIGRVITVSKKMMSATPYRGGSIGLELGLFSVKSGNVLTPWLDYVTRVSEVAGISSVAAVKPFLPLLVDGIDLIAGATKETALEVGIDTDLTMSKGSVATIIAAPRSSIDESALELKKDGQLWHKGNPLTVGYATFSFRTTLQKHDYGEIADLAAVFREFKKELNKPGRGKEDRDRVEKALQAVRAVAGTSPDLILSDALRLVEKSQREFDFVFSPTAAVADHGGVPTEDYFSLYSLDLYDEKSGPDRFSLE